MDFDQTQQIIADQIANAIAEAGDLTDQAQTACQDALTASMRYFVPGAIKDIPNTPISLPGIAPNQDLGALFVSEQARWEQQFRGDYAAELTKLENQFYPYDAMFKMFTDSQAWIDNNIENGGIGLPIDTEDAMFNRYKDREYESAAVAKDVAVTEFAARGYQLPAGSLASRFTIIDTQSQKNIAEQARTQVIEIYKIRLQTLTEAVYKAQDIYHRSLEQIEKFVMDYLSLDRLAGELAMDEVNAIRYLWELTAEFYRALVAVNGLYVDIAKFNNDMDFKLQNLAFMSFDASLKATTSAAVSVAEVLGRSAGAYIGAQNSMLQLSSTANTTFPPGA